MGLGPMPLVAHKLNIQYPVLDYGFFLSGEVKSSYFWGWANGEGPGDTWEHFWLCRI